MKTEHRQQVKQRTLFKSRKHEDSPQWNNRRMEEEYDKLSIQVQPSFFLQFSNLNIKLSFSFTIYKIHS